MTDIVGKCLPMICTIRRADRREALAVGLDVGDKPCEPHEMLWPRASLREQRHDVGKCLAHLVGQTFSKPPLRVPAHLAGKEDRLASSNDPVGIAARARPGRRLQDALAGLGLDRSFNHP